MAGASCLPIGTHTTTNQHHHQNQDDLNFNDNYELTIEFLDKGKFLFYFLELCLKFPFRLRTFD